MKLFCFFATLALANAQPAIVDVVNSASHIPTGFPSAGIAQGSLFALIGTGLASDPMQTAGFPLPTSGGLGGVSIQVAVGGANVDAIMVFAASTQVSAILPSSTPLGAGSVTINNNGATATAPIVVVASAPGIFPLSGVLGLDAITGATAMAFNVNGDGTTTFNFNNTPAQPGQTVIMVATGAGAIPSDETQSGVMDVPAAQLRVFVAGLPATNVSVARGSYPAVPSPLDVSTVPDGIAALDLIQFTVPAGVSGGCIVSVVVQSGSFVSNPATLAVSSDGSQCVDPTAADPGDTVTFNGTARVANISFTRILSRSVSSSATTDSGLDLGVASFIQYDASASSGVPVPVSSFSTALNLNPGSCNLQLGRAIIGVPVSKPAGPPPPPANLPTYLDAGPVLNVTGPNGTMQMKQQPDSGFYIGSFGNSLKITSTIPIPPSGKLFLDPGDYTTDDGAGGADVGPFTAPLTLTNPQLQFTNIGSFASVDRSQGVTVTWTGGDPNGYVTIVGTSSSLSGTSPGSISLLGSFQCSAPVSAGQFMVPAYVTSSLPATGLPLGTGGTGSIGIQTYVVNRFSIPTFDLGLITFQVLIGTATVYK